MTFRILFLVAALAALQPASAGASDLDSLKSLSGASFTSALNTQFRALQRKDLFVEIGECAIVDIKGIAIYDAKEAVEVLQPCASALSKRLKTKIRIETDEIHGLDIRVPALTPLALQDVRDLNYSVEKRGSMLLGFRVRLVRERALNGKTSTFRPTAASHSKAKNKKRSRRSATPDRQRGDSDDGIVNPGDLDELGNPRRRTSPGPDDDSDGPSRGDGDDGYIGGFPIF